MSKFQSFVIAELHSARIKFPNLNSAHEAYAVILEEVQEFWDECRKKDTDRDPKEMLSELVQISTMAQRAAEDLELI